MNSETTSSHAVAQKLCLACGLCCNGTIFADVVLQPGDDARRLRALAAPTRGSRSASRSPRLAQPCPAFDGCRCGVYAERPQHCRNFACALFKDVQAGTVGTTQALRVIRNARQQVDRATQLLETLGDHDTHLPLSARFRRTGKRLEENELAPEFGATYGELTLAMHDLSLLLADSFYPGRSQPAHKPAKARTAFSLAAAAVLLLGAALPLRGDQVEMMNGDRYVGHVLSISSNTIVLQSDVLGNARLPRSKVAFISFGRVASTNSASRLASTNAASAALAATSTNSTAAINSSLRSLGISTNLIRQVQKQFLSDAGPEANAKFSELLNGLMTGKLDVEDIRAQARSAADQLRQLQRESGEDPGFAAGTYLSLLEHFLKETAPPAAASNPSQASPKSSTKPSPSEE